MSTDGITLDAAALSFLLRSDGTTWRDEHVREAVLEQCRLALTQAERIATLEAELARERKVVWEEMTHAKTLRDALEKIAARGCHRVNDTSGHSDVYDAHEANVNEACEALEATPAASLAAHSQEVWDRGWEEGRRFAATNLAAHDAEVLERAAAVADDYDGDGVSKSGQYTQLGDGALTRSDIARAIRALAAQEVKP